MIYADENVWQPVAEGLLRRGWAVTTATEAGTLGFSDRDHVEYASGRGWLLLTFDDDFPELAAMELGDDHPGIPHSAQHGRDVGERLWRLDTTLQWPESRGLKGELIYP